ncbi:hypothetical protein DPMN_127330, partial [Dreissena polymorpha]
MKSIIVGILLLPVVLLAKSEKTCEYKCIKFIARDSYIDDDSCYICDCGENGMKACIMKFPRERREILEHIVSPVTSGKCVRGNYAKKDHGRKKWAFRHRCGRILVLYFRRRQLRLRVADGFITGLRPLL